MVEKLDLKRNYLSDEVIRAIQGQIFEGILKQGERLPSEKEMCELFNVGRSTLREAIKALVTAGLLEKKKDGTYVKNTYDFVFNSPFDPKLILKHINHKDLLEARRIMETQIVALSAERATEEDLVNMESILKKMEQTDQNFIKEDIDFHVVIAESSYNKVLINQIKTIRNLLLELQADFLKLAEIPQCHKHHSMIYEAIYNRNPVEAQKFMAEHLDDVERALNEVAKLDFNK